MLGGTLGRVYEDGETIYRVGDPANDLYVIQSGQVVLSVPADSAQKADLQINLLGPGEMFGVIALFQDDCRNVNAVAHGKARVLTIRKDIFLRRVHEDPSLAFQTLKRMAQRIHHQNQQIADLLHNQSGK